MARIEITAARYAALTDDERTTLALSAGPVALGIPGPDPDDANVLAWDHPAINATAVLAAAAELGVVVVDATPVPTFPAPEPGPYVPPEVFLPAPSDPTPDPLAVLVQGLSTAHTIAEIRSAAEVANEALTGTTPEE